ncbi:Kdo domain containing protein [Salinimicrobium tongyeongense]|uniref:Kdo domain containing protein n=1 Tax=Salinimicrobium tongyeongense TaxID=2809707 RepID=A0ABY6NPV3_9FLAO|nr:lipopolysaccharide kinase InaA family protein [Salinimicrobium tongyeongense]UZH54834.1 Kdo domain containing protein [Salinimicrobium tongyeongense]
MKLILSPKFRSWVNKLLEIIENFGKKGETIKDKRNQLKLFTVNGEVVNVKSFKVPNPVNKVLYRYFLKSKAKRSFENANYLLERGIGTPAPIAYAEESGLLYGRSYYFSLQIPYDLTYRELIHEPDYPQREEILRAFTRFTFQLHEHDILFRDHSPGNTLIQLNNGEYKFFLVDLNRMNFQKMDFEERMRNFHRITSYEDMVRIMANEYSKLVPEGEAEVFERMWFHIQRFQEKARKKQNLKKVLKIKK